MAAVGFATQIGVRYLKSRKKNTFISFITVISVLGVMLGVTALSVVLSVMSGFETDLKNRILGVNSHIILRRYGLFMEYEEAAAKARQVPGVLGAMPFIYDEVMVVSRLGNAGVAVRGVVPALAGEVSVLPKVMREGRLEFLDHPKALDQIHGGHISSDEMYDFPADARERLKQLQQQERERIKPDFSGPPEPMGSYGREDIEDLLAEDYGAPGLGSHRPRILPALLIGSELKDSLKVEVGDPVFVVAPLGDGRVGPSGPIPKSMEFRVAGVFKTGHFEFDAKLVYIHLKVAQQFLGREKSVSGVEIKINDLDRTGEIGMELLGTVGEIRDGGDRHGYPFYTQDWRTINNALFSALKLEKKVMAIILIFIVLVASFNIVSTLNMIVNEKRKEIAILKTMGGTDGAIIRIFMTIGVTIGGIGTVLGVVLGYALCRVIEVWVFKLPDSVYYIERLPVRWDPVEIVLVALSAIGISLLATIPPSLSAARVRPAESMRYD
ncbi:MAG: hypothetical protein GMKNLPBB_03147 [Myxococcota bacterium]|nr:hypothetical protein [Myxococcota bacterium]